MSGGDPHRFPPRPTEISQIWELKSKKFQGGAFHQTPAEACSFGTRLRKLVNIYLRSASERCILISVYLPNEFLDRCYKETNT